MKAIKITKTLLKDAAILLKKVGAVHGNQAFPSSVYMNAKDYAKLEKNIAAAFKKEYPYLDKKRLQFSVGMHLLNLGPIALKQGIAEGFILVDERQIANEIDSLKAESTEK